MNAVVRASTTLAVVLGGLGACLGAALATRDAQKPAGGATWQSPLQEVDKRAIAPLTPVRAPKDLGDEAFAHVRTLVGFGPRNPGTPGWSRQLDHIQRHREQREIEPGPEPADEEHHFGCNEQQHSVAQVQLNHRGMIA